MRIRTVLKFVALPVVLVVAAVVVFLATMDLSRYQPLIAQKVKEATGRDLDIGGSLRLALGLTPAIVLEDIKFQNATFGTRAEMIKARRLEADVALLPLLSGRVEINRLVLVGPDILLETDEKGRGNWDFSRDDEPLSPPPTSAEQAALDLPNLKSVNIENGLLTYRNGVSGKITKLEVVRFRGWSAGRDAPLDVDLDAAYDGVPFDVSGRLGAFVALGSPAAFPVDLTFETTDARLALRGSVHRPWSPTGLDLALDASASDLGGVARLLKTSLPAGPLSLSGKLTGDSGNLALRDVKGKLGGSDFTGAIRFKDGKTPHVALSIAAQQLHMADVELVETAPENGNRRAPAKADVAEAAPPNDADRLFSAAPLPFAALATINGELDATVEQLALGAVTIERVAVKAALERGRLTVPQWSGRFADGTVSGSLTLETPKNAATLTLRAAAVDAAKFAGILETEEVLTGTFDLTADLAAEGNSLRALMAGVSGTSSLVMGKGEVKSSYVELLGADLLRLAASAGSGGGSTPVTCMVSRFDIAKGLATSRDLLFDTNNMTVKGEGAVNLASERYDLKFTPRPKDVSLLNLAMPWRVTGPLTRPEVSLDETGAATRAAGALLSVINPLALLVPLVTSATGDKNPCVAALEAAQKPAAAAPPKKESSGVRGLLDRIIR